MCFLKLYILFLFCSFIVPYLKNNLDNCYTLAFINILPMCSSIKAKQANIVNIFIISQKVLFPIIFLSASLPPTIYLGTATLHL